MEGGEVDVGELVRGGEDGRRAVLAGHHPRAAERAFVAELQLELLRAVGCVHLGGELVCAELDAGGLHRRLALGHPPDGKQHAHPVNRFLQHRGLDLVELLVVGRAPSGVRQPHELRRLVVQLNGDTGDLVGGERPQPALPQLERLLGQQDCLLAGEADDRRLAVGVGGGAPRVHRAKRDRLFPPVTAD